MQYRVETLVRLNEAMAVVEEGQSFDACAYTVVHGIEAGSREGACELAAEAALNVQMGIGGLRVVSGRIVMQNAEMVPPPSWHEEERANFHPLDEFCCFYHGSWVFHKRLAVLKRLGWSLMSKGHRKRSKLARMSRHHGLAIPAWMLLPGPKINSQDAVEHDSDTTKVTT